VLWFDVSKCQIVMCSQLHAKNRTLTMYTKCLMYDDNGQKEDGLVIAWWMFLLSSAQQL